MAMWILKKKPMKKENKFKVGDEVSSDFIPELGKFKGIVRHLHADGVNIGVEFIGFKGGHYLNGIISSNSGYYIHEKDLKLVSLNLNKEQAKKLLLEVDSLLNSFD